MSGTDVTRPDLGGRGDGPARPTPAPGAGDGGGRRAARRRQDGRQPTRGGGVVLGAVGVLGELLITAGVLLLAFLAWQLWWTDVEANREQAALVQEQGWDRPLEALQASAPSIVTPRYDEPPVVDEPEYLTTFASMRIPRWDGEPTRTITQGTDRPNVLNPLGVGHYEGTAMPGGVGNFSLAAHRTTYGKPFNRVAELGEGDPIVVWTEDTWYVYRVTTSQIVMPDDVQVIAPVPDQPGAEPTERFITLTTCHPMFSARERYIVHGVLDYWAPVSEGVPAELAEVS